MPKAEMTVEQLIEALKRYDLKAKVLVSSRGDPCSIEKVTTLKCQGKQLPLLEAQYLWPPPQS